MIDCYHLGQDLILLGLKQNPFPYMKECQLYVQTSKVESYCITVAEARSLHKPIITTNTSASEQIVHEKTGLIVEYSEEELYKSIKHLLNDKVLKERHIKNLSMEEVDTRNEMNKFYRIVEKVNEVK